jgi:hypothetical protein
METNFEMPRFTGLYKKLTEKLHYKDFSQFDIGYLKIRNSFADKILLQFNLENAILLIQTIETDPKTLYEIAITSNRYSRLTDEPYRYGISHYEIQSLNHLEVSANIILLKVRDVLNEIKKAKNLLKKTFNTYSLLTLYVNI